MPCTHALPPHLQHLTYKEAHKAGGLCGMCNKCMIGQDVAHHAAMGTKGIHRKYVTKKLRAYQRAYQLCTVTCVYCLLLPRCRSSTR